MGIVSGGLLLLAYNSISKQKDFSGQAVFGCIFGLIGTLWIFLGWLTYMYGGNIVQADILIFVLSGFLFIFYIVILTFTFISKTLVKGQP